MVVHGIISKHSLTKYLCMVIFYSYSNVWLLSNSIRCRSLLLQSQLRFLYRGSSRLKESQKKETVDRIESGGLSGHSDAIKTAQSLFQNVLL